MSYNFEDKKSIDLTYKKILELLKLNIPKKTIIIIPTRKDFQFLNNTDYKNKYWYKKILSLSKKHNFKIIDLYEYFDSNIPTLVVKSATSNAISECSLTSDTGW